MSQGKYSKDFAEVLEKSVLGILIDEEYKHIARHRRQLDMQDLFIDMSAEALKRNNPDSMGHPDLNDREQNELVVAYRNYVDKHMFRGHSGNTYELSTLLADPKKYMELTRRPTSKVGKFNRFRLTKGGSFVGVLVATRPGESGRLFSSVRMAFRQAANDLDELIREKGYDDSVTSVLRQEGRSGKKNLYKTKMDLGHIGSGDAGGRTPLLNKLDEALTALSNVSAVTKEEKDLKRKIERFIQQGINEVNRAHAVYFAHTSATRMINDLALSGEVKIYYGVKQSQELNRILIGDVEGRASGIVRARSRKIVANQIADVEGSPSLKALLRLSAVQIIERGKGIMGRYTNKSTEKTQRSEGQKVIAKTKSVTPRNTKFKNLGASPKQGLSESILSIQSIINMHLHDEIKSRMFEPALQYRTGRFARSAQIVNAAPSRDGFITFGYTYMEDPYSTFEVGNEQGTPERDPRPLIEGSIRSLAQKMVGGKFRSVKV